MADVLTSKQRSFNMSQIRCKDTTPEVTVGKLLRTLGLTYSTHSRNLPGRPDIVLPRMRAIVFVHGCFWHMHKCRFGNVVPATHAKFWREKRMGNVKRDAKNLRALKTDWSVLTIWECETRDEERTLKKLKKFVGGLARDAAKSLQTKSKHNP